jgi:hypothetical protein
MDYDSKEAPVAEFTLADGSLLYPLNKTLIRRSRAAAYWSWMIAGVSALNVLFAFARAPVRLTFGLCLTDLLFSAAHSLGPIATYVSLVFILGIVGALALFGLNIWRIQRWAYVASLATIGIDTVLVALFWGLQFFYAFVVHLLAIYFTFLGLKAAKLYSARLRNGQA